MWWPWETGAVTSKVWAPFLLGYRKGHIRDDAWGFGLSKFYSKFILHCGRFLLILPSPKAEFLTFFSSPSRLLLEVSCRQAFSTDCDLSQFLALFEPQYTQLYIGTTDTFLLPTCHLVSERMHVKCVWQRRLYIHKNPFLFSSGHVACIS